MLGVGLMAAGAALLLGGFVLLVLALYLYLASLLTPPFAFLVCGVAALVAAGGLIWIGRTISR